MKARVRVVSLRHFDPVIRGLSHRAFRAWALSLEWSCFHGTDGALSPDDVKTVGATPAVTQELLKRGVWKRDESGQLFLAERRDGPVVAEVDGRDVSHALTGAERTRAWRAKKNSTSHRDVTERHGDEEKNVTVTASPSVTDCDVPPDPPQVSGSGSESGIQEGSSVPTSSDPKDLTGSARVSEPRAKPVLQKPFLMTHDWRPPQSAWDATLVKLECMPADLERHLPEFRRYWADLGKRKSQRGWVQAWGNRMSWLAEKGQLYMSRGASNGGSVTLRPDQEDRVQRLLATARH